MKQSRGPIRKEALFFFRAFRFLPPPSPIGVIMHLRNGKRTLLVTAEAEAAKNMCVLPLLSTPQRSGNHYFQISALLIGGKGGDPLHHSAANFEDKIPPLPTNARITIIDPQFKIRPTTAPGELSSRRYWIAVNTSTRYGIRANASLAAAPAFSPC